jgi:hypothetical protein
VRETPSIIIVKILDVVFFILGETPTSEFYMPTFRNTVYSISIGGVSRKNSRDEIFGVFIREKVWLENSLSQLEGGGVSEYRNRLSRARTPQVEVSNKYVRKKRRCVGARKGSHLMVEIKVLCFRWLSHFFKRVQKGFPGFA